MKSLWTVVSVLALANLFALAGFVGWLAASGRLDAERMEDIRRVLGETPQERTDRLEGGAAETQELQDQIEQMQTRIDELTQSPMTAEQQLEMSQNAALMDDQRAIRATREVEDLRNLLERELADVERRRADLEAREIAFEQRLAERDRVVGEQQFATAVTTLQGMRAPAARNMLAAIWNGQAASPVRDAPAKLVVVEYLRALDDRPRNKILAEFEKDDPTLAAELLERLRTDGLKPEVADASTDPDADPAPGPGTGADEDAGPGAP
ncbi:MAG: hypothetical protein AAFX79_00635 [Planctomycetota bacterium]